MTRNSKSKTPATVATSGEPRRRIGVFGVVALVAVAVAGGLFLKVRRAETAAHPDPAVPAATAETKPAVAVNPAVLRLAGRWLRPDGGYVLELRVPQPGGTLGAVYLNPRPIHVGRSAWWEKDGRPAVFVELQDTGYPGATYELVYHADRDQLVGTYTQPAVGQTFAVEFTRLGPPTEP